MADTIRRTKAALKASRTCYDAYLLGLKEVRDLCRSCNNYFNLPIKKKPQTEMGVRYYGCLHEEKDGIAVPTVNMGDSNQNKRKAAYCQLVSPTPAPKSRVHPSSSEVKGIVGRPTIQAAVEAASANLSSLVEYYKEKLESKEAEMEAKEAENVRLQDELQRSDERCSKLERELTSSQSNERQLQRSIQSINQLHNGNDAYHAAVITLKSLSDKNITTEDIVKGFVRALSTRKYKRHIAAAIQEYLSEVGVHFGSKMYDCLYARRKIKQQPRRTAETQRQPNGQQNITRNKQTAINNHLLHSDAAIT
jgi:hypothetical protein